MTTSMEWLAQGWQYQQNGNFGQAERIYRQVLQADPGQPHAWHLLADLCSLQRRLVESIPLYEQAAQLAPDVALTHYSLGNSYFGLRQLPEAERCYRQALVCQPDYPQAHNNLGVTLLEQRRYDDAIASYRQAVRLEPHYAEAFVNLANACKDKGRLDEAIACYRRSVELQPDNSIFHSYLLYILAFHPAYTPQAIFEEHLLWARRHAVLPARPLPVVVLAPLATAVCASATYPPISERTSWATSSKRSSAPSTGNASRFSATPTSPGPMVSRSASRVWPTAGDRCASFQTIRPPR